MYGSSALPEHMGSDPGRGFTSNDGLTWNNQQDTLSLVPALWENPSIGWAASLDNKIYKWQGTITSVNDIALENTPRDFTLSQNFSNPFNPSTEISFQLPFAAHLSLSVYDLLGREIAVLISEEKPAGNHAVTWNADRVASGMYFYRLEARGEDGMKWGQTRKMVFLR